jgi:heme oxygenase|tara:strand:+ start:474 stop:656 length:183 start_codon:yes stop_codon:yes gene_type:complete
MAEKTGFVSCFLKGVVDRFSYLNLVAAIRKVLFGFLTRRQHRRCCGLKSLEMVRFGRTAA